MKTVLIALVSVVVHSVCYGFENEDSLRTKWMNGKGIILHKVDPKETWTGIARKYNVALRELMSENEGVTDLKTGQIIIVPVTSSQLPQADEAENITSSPLFHTVQTKETLFSISKKFNITIADIKEWNNLATSQVNKGQKLIIGYKEKKAAKDEPTGMITDEKTFARQTESMASSQKESPVLMKSGEVITADAGNTVPASPSPRKPLKEMKETGQASWITGNEPDRNKYYALHRTASIGTIIKVTNRMNGKYVFVKVVGDLPETGDNDNIIIKLSQAAAARLGVIDARFQAELSYGVETE